MADHWQRAYPSVVASESGREELLFFHPVPQPDVCDVCAYVRDETGADQLVEHTQTRVAIGLMIDDLRAEGQPMHMLQLHRSTFGYPGPEHRIEPRHWFWALLVYPALLVMLDETREAGTT
jgi:hypothetical protein